MADLSVQYCGTTLASPLLVSASPLTATLPAARALQEAGAAGVVLPSLFEESVNSDSQLLDAYCDRLKQYKDELDIPVFASLNGVTQGGWLDHAERLQQAGCDGIELNIYYVAANVNESSDQIERRYIDLVYQLRSHIGLPMAVKLSQHFSSVAHLIKRLEDTGIDAVVLFNRFYQPDFDIETLTVTPSLQLSTSQELLLRVRWVALLRQQVRLGLAVTGGVHEVPDLIKALLAGADAVQLCSVLFAKGNSELARLRDGLEQWLEDHNHSAVTEIQGIMSQGRLRDPSVLERANYREVLQQNS
ncbi:MAG: dihydroorotate dehydrogenase [Pseudomonadales bacterium]|nr:dihydroorotate dehydrogenase [Pseudomonadales bacterium]